MNLKIGSKPLSCNLYFPDTIQTIPNDLQYAIVPLVDSETCNDAWTTLPNQERISDSMQCAGGDGATACTVRH